MKLRSADSKGESLVIFSLACITLRAVRESLVPLSNSLNHHPKRTLATLALSASFTALLGFAALAGQGVSQYCSDNVGYEEHIINSPVTFNAEAGGPVGPQGWSWIVCFSPTAWGDGSPAPTGGAGWFGSTQGTSGGNNWVGCGSDNNSTTLQFGCNDQVNTNLSNPTSPSANLTYSNGVNVPGVAGAQTSCPYGYTVGTGGVGCGSGGPSTRPSQNCADNIGNQQAVLHDPATLDFDLGSSPGSYNFVQTCYSTSPYQSSTNQVTGGLISTGVPSASGQSTWCASDPAAMVRLDCSQGTNLNTSNPTSPSASTSVGGQVTVLGTPVPISGTGAGVQTGCAYGYTVGTGGVGCGSGGPWTQWSQACADNGGNEYRVIHNPITLDIEPGSSPGATDYMQACYSTAPYGSTANQVTGGGIKSFTPQNGGATYCYSDPAAMVKVDCATSAEYNPSSNVAHYGVWGQATILNTPVTIPGTIVQAGTGCANGTVAISASCNATAGQIGIGSTGATAGLLAISTSGTGVAPVAVGAYDGWGSLVGVGNHGASGSVLAVSGEGCANSSGGVAASGTSCANGSQAGISGTGNSSGGVLAASATGCSDGDANPSTGIAISGTNCAWGGLLGASALGSSWGKVAVGGSSCSNGQELGVNATGCATSWLIGISGTGTSSATGYQAIPILTPGAAISGTNASTGKDIAVSGTGQAFGGSVLNVNGANKTVTVAGVPVAPPPICPGAYAVTTSGVGCSPGGSTGKGPSQWCDDGYGNARPLIHDPITLDTELDESSSYGCYSTTAFHSGALEATGGAASIATPSTNGSSVNCWSDPAAAVRLDCSAGTGLNTQNPTTPSASTSSGGQVTALGTPVPVSGTSTGIGVGCTSGTVAISVTGCANGQIVGVSGLGAASATGYQIASGVSPGVAVAGGDASASTLAVGEGNAYGNLAAVAVGNASSPGGLAAISVTGSGSGATFSHSGSTTPQTVRTQEETLVAIALNYLAAKNSLLLGTSGSVESLLDDTLFSTAYVGLLWEQAPSVVRVHDQLAADKFFYSTFNFRVIDTSFTQTADGIDLIVTVGETWEHVNEQINFLPSPRLTQAVVPYLFSFVYQPNGWQLIAAAEVPPPDEESEQSTVGPLVNPVFKLYPPEIGNAIPEAVFDRVDWTEPIPNGLPGPPGLTNVQSQSSSPQSTSPSSSNRVNIYRSLVADYASNWAMGRNPAYRSFTGNDCTNFISQALRAGGWPFRGNYKWGTSSWWYNSETASEPWVNSHAFWGFLHYDVRADLARSIYDLWDGDIVQVDWHDESNGPGRYGPGGEGKPDGIMDHSMVVTFRDGGGMPEEDEGPYVSYHSNNTQDRLLAELQIRYPRANFYGWILHDTVREYPPGY